MNHLVISEEIEKKSYQIIESLLRDLDLAFEESLITKRVIHTTADLSYATELIFHPQAVSYALKALGEHKNIITDVNMVRVGISKYKGEIFCFIEDETVLTTALRLNITRAAAAMKRAADLMEGGIVVIGNAPTALSEVCKMVENKKANPRLIIGVPVGFIGAIKAKKRLQSLSIPYITNKSQKGGSPVAVAIVNTLLRLAQGKKNDS